MRAPELSFVCPRRWEQLQADPGGRYCNACQDNVHDLCAMSPSRAQRFLREHPDACIRFRTDHAGRLVTNTVHLVVLSAAVAMGGCAHPSSASTGPVSPEHPEVPAQATLSAEAEDAGLTPRPAFSPPGRIRVSRYAWRDRGGGDTMGR